jgi:hypothetical protein
MTTEPGTERESVELVERLRKYASGYMLGIPIQICGEAADMIERLSAERELLAIVEGDWPTTVADMRAWVKRFDAHVLGETKP